MTRSRTRGGAFAGWQSEVPGEPTGPQRLRWPTRPRCVRLDGEGDLPTPAFIGDAAAEALRAGKTFYPPQNGIPQLRQALAQYLTGLHARPVERQEITITVGAMDAILLALITIVEAGDNVIVVDPV